MSAICWVAREIGGKRLDASCRQAAGFVAAAEGNPCRLRDGLEQESDSQCTSSPIAHDSAFNTSVEKCGDRAQVHAMDRCFDVDLPRYPARSPNFVLMLLLYSRSGRNPRPGVQEFCGFFPFPPQEKRLSSVAKRSSLHLRKGKADTSLHQKRALPKIRSRPGQTALHSSSSLGRQRILKHGGHLTRTLNMHTEKGIGFGVSICGSFQESSPLFAPAISHDTTTATQAPNLTLAQQRESSVPGPSRGPCPPWPWPGKAPRSDAGRCAPDGARPVTTYVWTVLRVGDLRSKPGV